MRHPILVFAFSLICFMSFSQSNNSFYYAFDDQINLNPVTNKFAVEFKDTVNESLFTSNNLIFNKLTQKLYEVEGVLDTIQNVGQGLYDVNQVYETNGGARMYMTNSIILKWNDGVTQSQRNNLISQFDLVETKSTRLYNVYDVNVPLTVSQMVYETGLVRYCHPSFAANATQEEHIPNDQYFNQQWHLHNTGQQLNDGHYGTADADIDAPEAWDLSLGSIDIVVAVLDGGITDNHTDLPSSRQMRLPGSNFDQNDGLSSDNPSPIEHNNHGNACAGIIAAEMDNNEGVAGIAPECTIMSIKIPFENSVIFDYADAITFAVDNGAHIISNSWSFQQYDNPNQFPIVVMAIEDAIENGVVVLFAAGNTANRVFGYDGYVSFPGNANIPNLITVGASDRNDVQSNYSPTDVKLDICAPSGTASHGDILGEAANIWSIDIPGEDGYNSWHRPFTGPLPIGESPLPEVGEVLPDYGINHLAYTGRFSGTSAATPMVAGVVALMLSVNPCLSVTQVLDILHTTAEKVGGYDYAWNENQPGHSQELGYGRLNAHLAVKAAQDLNTEGLDLYTKDDPYDFGVEPNETAEFLWVSEDIWVRNSQDGLTMQVHENPEYSATQPVYVYVRVRNRGCEASLGTEELKLYWSKAATALTWPDYWDGSITSPELMGDVISVKTLDVIEAGEETIVEFEWFPPNPFDYEDINDEPWHFCLLSRIVATNDPMNNELPSGTWNLGHNVKHNNNIAWKNISVVNFIRGITGGFWDDDRLVGATIAIGNASDTTSKFDFDFKVPSNLVGDPITKSAEVRLTLDETTWEKWEDGGFKGENVSVSREDRRQLIVHQETARLENLTYSPHERSLIDISFNFLTEELSGKTAFDYHVVQSLSSTGEVLGGEKYHITIPPREAFTANAGDDREITPADSVQLSALDIVEDAIYNWYDAVGNLIHTGKDLTVAPAISQKYKLEVIAESDGFKDYDEVDVNVQAGEIINISPNPSSDFITVTYETYNGTSAYLMLTKASNGNTDNFVLDLSQDTIIIDVNSHSFGVYGLLLVIDGQIVDQQGLIIE